MKYDLFDDWKEPQSVISWGKRFEDPIKPAWDSFLSMKIEPEFLIVIARFLIPGFRKINSCYLIDYKCEGFDDQTLKNFSLAANSYSEFERNFNSTSLYEAFAHSQTDNDSIFVEAANCLKISWSATVKSLFPNERFEIVLENTQASYGPRVTIFKIR